MKSKVEFLKKAFDSDAFITSDQYAVAVNPKLWDTELKAYEEKNIVFTNHCEQYDFRKPGRDLTVTVDAAPSIAASVAETDAVSVQPISNRQVTFTPVEYGTSIQTSKNETEDAFFEVASNATKKLGYSLGLKKDALGMAIAVTNATSKLVVNNVDSSAIGTSDTLGIADFTRARGKIKSKFYRAPMKVFIGNAQEEQMLNISQIQKANEWGTREAIDKGLIGNLVGVDIYVTDSVLTSGTTAKALFMGSSLTGESAVAYAVKRDPTIETDYDPSFRQYKWIATERYNFQVIHPDALVTVESYAAY